GAGAVVGPPDEDASQSERARSLQVVVGIGRNVPPVAAEGDAQAARRSAPHLRVRLVSMRFFGTNPAIQSETELGAHLLPMREVAVGGGGAGGDRTQAAERLRRIGVERPSPRFRSDAGSLLRID